MASIQKDGALCPKRITGIHEAGEGAVPFEVKDRDCDGIVDQSDEVFLKGRWVSADEFQRYLLENKWMPKQSSIIGKEIDGVQMYAQYIDKARSRVALESRLPHGIDDEDIEDDSIACFQMAQRISAELGFGRRNVALTDMVRSESIKVIEDLCEDLKVTHNLRSIPIGIYRINRSMDGAMTFGIELAGEVDLTQKLKPVLKKIEALFAEGIDPYLSKLTILQEIAQEYSNLTGKPYEPIVRDMIRRSAKPVKENIEALKEGYRKSSKARDREKSLGYLGDLVMTAIDHGVPIDDLESTANWVKEKRNELKVQFVRECLKTARENPLLISYNADSKVRAVLETATLMNRPEVKRLIRDYITEALNGNISIYERRLAHDMKNGEMVHWFDSPTIAISKLVCLANELPELNVDYEIARFEKLCDEWTKSWTPEGHFFTLYHVEKLKKGFDKAFFDRFMKKHSQKVRSHLYDSLRELKKLCRTDPDDVNCTSDGRILESISLRNVDLAREIGAITDDESRRLYAQYQKPSDDAVVDMIEARPSEVQTASLTAVTPKATQEDIDRLKEFASRYVARLSSYTGVAQDGTNLIYGPVADIVDHEDSYMARARRAFFTDPESAALFAKLTLEKTKRASKNAICVIKHAPGIGAVFSNPEWTGKVVVDARTAQELERDMKPFTEVMNGSPSEAAVMISGVAYTAIDAEEVPAVFSQQTTEWIRSRLPDDTVLITDDLSSKTLRKYIKARIKHDPCATLPEKYRAIKEAIASASNAGSDIFLFYDKSRDFVNHFLRIADELAKEGTVPRTKLEASVRRILKLKKRSFPEHPMLADIDATVAKMSDRQLWLQKVVFPAFTYTHSRHLAGLQVGGIAFEGVRRKESIQKWLEREAMKHPDRIPPFRADNSPQEVASRDSASNRTRELEIGVMSQFAELAARIFPNGIPKELAAEIFRESFQGE